MNRRELLRTGFNATLASTLDFKMTRKKVEGAGGKSQPVSTTLDEKPIERYGGMYAPWNIRADQLPVDPNSASIVRKFYEIAGSGLNINSDQWCPVFYRIEDATDDVLCVSENPSWGNLHNVPVRWNPSWRVPAESDAKVVVIGANGHCYEFWRTSFANKVLTVGSANLVQRGISSDEVDHPADIRTKSNGYRPVRACGLPSVVTTVFPEEIEQGFIPHALDLSWNHPARGAYVAPAIKGAGGTGGSDDRLPMGMRLVWAFTDDMIEAWARTLDPGIRTGMRAIAVAMRDYGMIGTDNGGRKHGCALRCAHDLTANYHRFGFDPAKARKSFDGLWAHGRAVCRVVAPPVFPNDDMSRTARYPGISYPDSLI